MSGGTHVITPRRAHTRRLRGSHPLRRPVPAVFGWAYARARAICRPLRVIRPTPPPQRRQPPNTLGVWAPPRSLAATKGILSAPRGTEMFQFPRCPPRSRAVPGYDPGRVAPFGDPWLTGSQRLPRAFRRVGASFFGVGRLGIHRALIVAATVSARSRARTGPRPRHHSPHHAPRGGIVTTPRSPPSR